MRILIVYCFILSLIVSGNVVNSLDLGLGKVLTSAKGITAGVAKDASNLLPTPEGLFESGKNLIAGYPFEFASTAINKICKSKIAFTDNLKYTTAFPKSHTNFRPRVCINIFPHFRFFGSIDK